jgi:SPP1 gp7 family putative phage head morphogenesis protein
VASVNPAQLIPLLPPERALQWLAQRRAVTRGVFGLVKENAFTVAYLSATEQIQRVLDSLARALATGQSIAEWRASLDDLQLTAPHLNTVYRNAVFGALNEGRYQEFIEDIEDYPWGLYETAGDDKVRPSHEANDGLAMPLDDPRWEGRIPQIDHNCRCILLNFTEEDARARARITSPDPDSLGAAGWGASPFLARKNKSLRDELPRSKRPPEEFMGAALELNNVEDISAFIRSQTKGFKMDPKQSVVPGDVEWLKSVNEYDRRVLALHTTSDGGIDYRFLRQRVLDGEVLTKFQNSYLLTLRDSVVAAEKVMDRAVSVSAPQAASKSYKAPPYALPAYYTRTFDAAARHEALGKVVDTLKPGDKFKLSGVTSFNANGAVYKTRQAYELVVVSRARVAPVGPLSQNYFKGAEEEVLMWGADFKVVRVEDVVTSNGKLHRIYVERVNNAEVDYVFAGSNFTTPLGAALPNGTDLDFYLDAVLVNAV